TQAAPSLATDGVQLHRYGTSEDLRARPTMFRLRQAMNRDERWRRPPATASASVDREPRAGGAGQSSTPRSADLHRLTRGLITANRQGHRSAVTVGSEARLLRQMTPS